jgi:type III restriction enzyme
MREELLETLRSLADREYQHKVWLERDYPPEIKYDCFDEVVHFLYDDTVLAENPDAAIGVIIEDEKEAGLISVVCQAIDLVFEALGTGVSDEEYIKSSEWTSVVEVASRALQAMEIKSQEAVNPIRARKTMRSGKKAQANGMLIPSLLQGDVEGWRNTGWPGVTQTTAELLSYWFEEEREGASFHLCQQQAIETIIYCHEILGIQTPSQLYQEFAPADHRISEIARSKFLQDELNPIAFPKFCLKMATGSGKTWVLNALIVWHYFNAINGEKLRDINGKKRAAPLGFTNRFLIVTPGNEVQKRIIESINGKKDGTPPDLDRPLFMPSGTRWRDRFNFELYTPNDFRENLTLTDAPFLMVTNWQQFRFAKDDPSLWEDLLGEREEVPKGEIIADLLTEYPDICVLNDEAHHVHATKRPNIKTGKDEELIWRRFMLFLHQRQTERHADAERVFQQIDFSATPFYGSGDKKEYFPHIVYDYDLAQASADMLVKQLFLEQRQGINLESLDFKAEREPAEGKKRGELLGLSRGQKVMLEIGKSKLEQLAEEFKAQGINRKPVMLVLAEETKVADLVGEHFNTLDDEQGNQYNGDRVVVYHSNLKDAEKKAAEAKLDEIDKDSKPLRVVVSVLSVREGFDRTNICVIVMLRASEADLLLEQIVGRGLRLMFPSYKPEYDQIQDLKQEARQQLLDRESPSNAFDCLFLVEHPKFTGFYETYLRQQGYAVGCGNSSGQNAAGDLETVDADSTRIPLYDIAWPVQFFDETPIPNLAEVDINSIDAYPMIIKFAEFKKMATKTTITDVHIETDTKAKTWELENDYFDYFYFLQKVSRAITQSRNTSHLTSLSAEIAALVDEYVSRRLFKEEIDFTDPDNYKVFQGISGQQVTDFVTRKVRAAIQQTIGDIQYQPGARWRKLSDVPRLLMREKNMVLTPRCIYPNQAVQGDNKGGFERDIINQVLIPSHAEVLAFAKLHRKHDLTIPYRDDRGIQRKYEPDFVVKTADKMFLSEAKGDYLINDPSIALKTQAAVSWCKSASTVTQPNGQPQAWEYIMLKQSVFDANPGASFRELLPTMRQQRDELLVKLYGTLGIEV